MASNKVGHDFPTGPLDIIQSWLEITVLNDQHQVVWTSGKRDPKLPTRFETALWMGSPTAGLGWMTWSNAPWENSTSPDAVKVEEKGDRAKYPYHRVGSLPNAEAAHDKSHADR